MSSKGWAISSADEELEYEIDIGAGFLTGVMADLIGFQSKHHDNFRRSQSKNAFNAKRQTPNKNEIASKLKILPTS